MIESKENHYSYESKKRNNETLHFEHTNVLKKIFLFILLFAVLFTFSPLTYAEQNDRYMVLVLDVSGPTTFKEPASWMNLFGVHYTSDSSIESVKATPHRK